MSLLNYILIVFFIIISGIAGVYYRLYILKKKAYFLRTRENTKILVQIKALKKANDRLEISRNELQEINRNKDKFISIISHDFRGPLNSLTALLQILMKYAESFSKDELKDFGRNMDKSVHNLLDLLENLFKWSQSQSKQIEHRPEVFVLAELIYKTVNLLEPTAHNKNILIQVEVDPIIKVNADKHMMSFILRNLLSNAIKFTHKGGVVRITSQTKNNEVEIAVSDNGVGISKEVLSKLFRINTCFTSNGTENEMGTGLGLILCQEFVQKNGGIIQVESELKQGTTFRFCVPLVYEEVEVEL
ncbi:HAMP domain-containing histidine kinase [Rhodocytophaga rosea]|uniref:histidine kinase n=1 Tax=Rhodocytophaga rosea TaxID=2704465 RepID=A0A6C0GR36_9BACT|nr:HAMP domain-containing sensor histidine kinase [Rhodocytophaga rosea]QHT70529.1 HAMP domain-containing histidine kinase [Rhodocytophaga rosea]